MWPIIPTSFPPTPWVKTHRLNVSKTSCNSSTYFAYFNSWQKVDRETSVVKFEHHPRAHLEGLTKFWGFWGSSAPLYSPFCTLKTCTFDLIPLPNPNLAWPRGCFDHIREIYKMICLKSTKPMVCPWKTLQVKMWWKANKWCASGLEYQGFWSIKV